MKLPHLLASLLTLFLVTAGTAATAEEATWAQGVQSAIASLDLSDDQKGAIASAFQTADSAYGEAIAAARQQIGAILTDEQKQGLADMADAELQRRLQGDSSARGKSIGDIASQLGVTDAQSSAIT